VPETDRPRADPAARVLLGGPAPYEPLLLEAGEDSAQVAGVDGHCVAQHADVERLGLGQLVQHPRLGEGVIGAQQALVEHPDHPGVEAVERPDGVHAVGRGGRFH
jgi:hypothetical protein